MKENLKIVAVEPIGITKEKYEALKQEFASYHCTFTLYTDRKEDNASLKERIADNDIVIISNIPLKKEVLEQCPNVKLIAVAFTGVDHIDTAYCKQRGIDVVNASGYATQAVSELTIGLMIDALRQISYFNNTIRQGGSRDNFLGTQISNKTIGIIGTGAIGSRVCLLLRAFGANVLAYSHRKKPLLERESVQYVSLQELVSSSDIISLHVPLNDSTYHLLSKDLIDKCKPNAVIINTARGNVVDMDALAKKLNEDKLIYATDVYEQEPPLPANHPLLQAKNTICVPHIAFATKESFACRIEIVKNNIIKWLSK